MSNRELVKGGITEIIVDDLRALLFWASVGVHFSKGGYAEEDILHILESYAENLNFTLPYAPKWSIERLPSFVVERHAMIQSAAAIRKESDGNQE